MMLCSPSSCPWCIYQPGQLKLFFFLIFRTKLHFLSVQLEVYFTLFPPSIRVQEGFLAYGTHHSRIQVEKHPLQGPSDLQMLKNWSAAVVQTTRCHNFTTAEASIISPPAPFNRIPEGSKGTKCRGQETLLHCPSLKDNTLSKTRT
jgi:hypothetical protein